MKVFNFISPNQQELHLLVHLITIDEEYEVIAKMMAEEFDTYIAKDQVALYNKLMSIQMDIDIGARFDELPD